MDLPLNKEDLLREAYKIAVHSRDKSTQLGALLYRDGQIICGSENNFPRGVAETKERLQRPTKYMYVEHAERGAIYKAAMNGVPVHGTILICPWFSCADCARAIVLSGIKHVVGHKQMFDKMPPHWEESVNVGLGILKECNVTYEIIDAELNTGLTLRFNGELWTP